MTEAAASAQVDPWILGLLGQVGAMAVRMQVAPDVRVVALVGAVEALSGLREAELREDPSLLWRLCHAEDRRSYSMAVSGGGPQTVVVRWQRRRGPLMWTEHVIEPWWDDAGQRVGFAATIRDVTAQHELASTRETLERVQRDGAYFRTLIHTVNDGILVNDADGAIEFINHQLAALLRARPEEMIGRFIFDYMDEESASTARSNLQRRRAGAEDQFDFRWKRNDGSEFWSIVAAKPLYDADGRHRGSLVAVTDITRRKQAEDALLRARDDAEAEVEARTRALALEVAERRRAEAEAQAASRTKSLFLANMSHELRTPLNAIIGYSELAHEDAETPQMRADLERVRGAAEHLLALINNILDLSKIEAAKVEVAPESFVLGELVAELRTTILPLVIKNQNRLQVHCPIGERRIVTDRTKLKQILLNLLSNACKFTRRGWVDLKAGTSLEDGVEWLEVEVADTGIGIPEGKLADLFQAFAQADGSVSRTYGGTGLGLAISRELARLLGGDIGVESVVGTGTTFQVRIPVQAGVADEVQAAS